MKSFFFFFPLSLFPSCLKFFPYILLFVATLVYVPALFWRFAVTPGLSSDLTFIMDELDRSYNRAIKLAKHIHSNSTHLDTQRYTQSSSHTGTHHTLPSLLKPQICGWALACTLLSYREIYLHVFSAEGLQAQIIHLNLFDVQLKCSLLQGKEMRQRLPLTSWNLEGDLPPGKNRC